MSVSPDYSRAPLRLLLRPITAVVPAVQEEEVDGRPTSPEESPQCTTPTSEEFKLPGVPRSCPPAPRKPQRAIRCKRRLSELEFVVVRQEEMESLFRRRGGDSSVPSQPAAKKKKIDH